MVNPGSLACVQRDPLIVTIPKLTMETTIAPTDNLPKEHPLFNSVVLKQVFRYLKPTANLETLKTIRQVCTVWRDESLHWWRKTAILKVMTDRYEPLKCPPYIVTTFTWLMFQLQDPVNCYRFQEQPFQQYKLKAATIDVVYAFEEGTKANAFWTFLGVHVQHLILDHVTFLTGLSSSRRNDLMQFLIHFFPNLKSLTVNQIGFQKREWGLEVNDFLALTPVLSSVVSLKIDGCKYFSLDNFPNLQNLTFTLVNGVWQEVTKKIENSTVTSLTVNCTGVIYNLESVPKFTLLVLQNLSVKLNTAQDSAYDHLPKLVGLHGETLKTLQVMGWPLQEPYPKFPFKCQLDQLTELHLWGNAAKDLSFLKWTPKLKVLQWDLYCLEKQNELRNDYNVKWFYTRPIRYDIMEKAMSRGKMDQVVLTEVDYLQINCGYSLNSLKKLGEWMPNVKTLKIILWPGSISVIGNQWPLLEHLVGLFGSTIRDKDVIGNGERKSLLDLRSLKTFHVYSTCNEGLLTDVVVDSVFLEMRNLKDLQFCASALFSDEAEARLNERIPKVKVIRNYTANKEHVNWECCKNAEFMQFLLENACTDEDDELSDSSNSSWETFDEESDNNEAEEEVVGHQE